jgi:hypothetical protein
VYQLALAINYFRSGSVYIILDYAVTLLTIPQYHKIVIIPDEIAIWLSTGVLAS